MEERQRVEKRDEGDELRMDKVQRKLSWLSTVAVVMYGGHGNLWWP